MNRLLIPLLLVVLSLSYSNLSKAQAPSGASEIIRMCGDKPCEDIEAISPAVTAAIQVEQEKAEETTLAKINSALTKILFFDVSFGLIQNGRVTPKGTPILGPDGTQELEPISTPFIVLLLLFGGIYFTFIHRWIGLRGFKHAVNIVRGKYDDPEDKGEISHFRALTSALSATVGLGNIAGVAVAIQLGGPGAVFWMLVTAVFGMASKFNSCTLAQIYRQQNPDGSISGGPMYYLDLGLRERGGAWKTIGKVLAIMFAFLIMGGALGGGNMFQANQTAEAIRTSFNLSESANLTIGLVLAAFVALVILGGIKRIGLVTSRIVPFMVGIYVAASLFIIFANISELPHAISLIFTRAFSGTAIFGGFFGVLITGLKRAAFSNEAGLGSAAIAHAAAKTKEPIREGMVAMLGPFIDTIVVCFMTAAVVIITGAWNDPSIPQEAGVALTSAAFGSVIPWFPSVLTICIILFAYSSMISWCYYGERGWIYLLDHFDGMGLKTVKIFRLFFVAAVVVGATNSLTDVLNFSDMMILALAFPNIIGGIILAPKVKEKLDDYWERCIKNGIEK